ncbi:MAG: MBOAT family protein, partial [Treponema sp.]|nr:MBOAT family protein [Treponema sp.]
MSYIFDVYRKTARAQKNCLNVALYVSLFPQLIAGPIVRYQTVAEEIEGRKETAEDFTRGFSRFIVGLGKKLLLANYSGFIADQIFDIRGDISAASAWLGAVAYTLQIFFDFSAYSDMAIGLGRIFGFHFLENFNYPYMARSITDFWRRWHISLSTW